MKHSSRRYLISSCLCVLLLPLALSRVSSQTPSPALLDLKSCGRALTVFDDRTVVETYAGNQTRRLLSEKQMSKLRKVIAIDPCEQQWRKLAAARKTSSAKPSQEQPIVMPNDCNGGVLGYGPGLLEMFVTRHYPDHAQSMVVYIPCGHDLTDPFFLEYVKPKWQRFLYGVVDALGGKSIIEACGCGRSNLLRDKTKPAVYLSFERADDTHFFLRITNNSQWPIIVPLDSRYDPSQPMSRLLSAELGEISGDGWVEVKYRVEGDMETKHFVSYALARLPAGKSTLFIVRRDSVTDKDIYVPFLYEWDNQPEIYDEKHRFLHDPNLEHRVYFRSYDLIKELTNTE